MKQSAHQSEQQEQRAKKLATFLGWFSVGLGVAELIAPDGVARLVGTKPSPKNRTLLRVAGARELAAGIGILSSGRPKGWVWSRVGGDVWDLAMLGSWMTSEENERGRLNVATLAVLGVTALDIVAGSQLGSNGQSSKGRANGQASVDGEKKKSGLFQGGPINVKRSITVNRPRQEVYAFWHDFQNLPRFMKHLESVTITGEGRSHWTAKAPAGSSVEWDAEVTADREGSLISWKSVGSADVDNVGTVRFVDAPGDRGTEVHVELRYSPPGGALGALVAKMFGEEPGGQIADDLRRFKQVMEIGEPMLSDASMSEGLHPAQPAATPQRS